MSTVSIAASETSFLPLPFLPRDIELEERADGVLYLRSRVPLRSFASHLPAVFKERAAQHPDRNWLVAKAADRSSWLPLTYGEAAQQIDAISQWLLNLQQPERAVMVLSGNSVEHALLSIGAMQARMPYVPITPAYALLAQDFERLRNMVARTRPAVIFVQNGKKFERALRALPLDGVSVIYVEDAPEQVPATAWAELLNTQVEDSLAASVAALTPDTVAKYLFTSGSTGTPKIVPVTQNMITSSMAMHAQTVTYDPEQPAVLLEWLPWSHVAGGTAVFNSVIDEGGTMYLDDGRPVPGEFERTLQNLRDVAPTRFSSVPAGYAMLADTLEADDELAAHFFSRLGRLTSSGARLPDAIYHRLQKLAVRHRGYYMPFVAGFGSTETCAATMVVHWPGAQPGLAGLPQPGIEIKLLPLEGERYEVRVKGPSVMKGYLDQPEINAEVFDDEGFYSMGDAVHFVDRSRPEEGLAFAGRVAEEFKLMSGVYVRTGSLRVDVINATAPLVSDAVIAGADRAYVAVLLWLNQESLRRQFASLGDKSPAESPEVQAWLKEALQQHNQRHGGSSMRIARALVLSDPPSMDAGELTDKGYVNQRAVLSRRASEVERLYAAEPDPAVIIVEA